MRIDWTNVVAFLAALAPVLAWLEVRAHYRNKRLEARLRLALKDCRAFYEIEMRLCGALLRAGGDSDGADKHSELAIKRFYRLLIRSDGLESPSEQATPKRIAEELARL